MADDEEELPARRGIGVRIAKWAAIVLAVLLLLLALGYAWLQSDSGRRFVAGQIEALEFENGMEIGVGRLEGSLFGKLTIEDLTLSDPEGVFFTVPEAKLDWRPLGYLFGHLEIHSLTAESATLARIPAFNEVPPDNQPLLPDLDIDLGEFRIARFVAEPAVSGERRVLTMAGTAQIADGRAIADFSAETLGEGAAGGDRLLAKIDAVPDDGRLGMELSLFAPQDGVIAALAGLSQPLKAELKGSGDWSKWDGTLDATLGTEKLAGLTIGARDGRFSVKGETRAALLVEGSTARLFGPVAEIDLTADLDQRRAALSGTIASDTLRIEGEGTLDLGESAFDQFKLSLALLQPAALAENLTGNGFAGNFILDGPFNEPTIDYNVAAARIGINDIGLERFRAKGVAEVNTDGFLVPVDASAARITGLDTIAGGTLANVTLGGKLAVQGTRILSDDLRIRSDRIDATATVIADVSTGFYAGGINGRINNYRVESVGIFNIDSDMELESARGGGFALDGRIRARSTRIDNESLANFLGGEMLAASDVRYGTDGIIRLSNISLEAPLVRVDGGSGTYRPDGQIALELDARTERYGPVALTLDGTLAEPHAMLAAESPGFGIGLANLTAEITGEGSSYRLVGEGETDYGPLTADVTLDASDRLAFTINQADLGGIGFTGALEATDQGPFAGRLLADGRGLGGVVQLSARGAYQQADFNLRAKNTRLDGAAGLSVGSAIVDGRLVLYDQPEIDFDAQVSNANYRGYRFNAARAQVDYRGGKGTAKFVVEGSLAFPFRVAANAELEPEMWRATVKGRIRGIDIASKGPLRIAPREDSYALLPSRFSVGSGTMSLAGEYGTGLNIQSRLEDIDIAMANAFVPGLGIGGKASGSLDFAQSSPSAFPSADARVKLRGFTRTTAVSVSQPVDVNFAGKLLPDGGEGSAVFRRGSTVIGRMKASLRPLAPGAGDWVDRLLGAPLSGGVRYNGPAATLFSLAGQADQRLSGSIGLAADFSGRVRSPRLAGVIKGNDLTYENLSYGTRLTNLALDGRLNGDRIEIQSLTANAGSGKVKAQGYISLAADRGFPMDIAIDLDEARLARSETLGATATGKLKLTKEAGETALLSGTLYLPETRYKIVREGVAQVPQLSGVRFKPRPGRTQITGEEQASQPPPFFENVRYDIDVTAPERLYVSGMGLESEWRANLHVSGTSASPRVTGSVDAVRGTLGFAGRSFRIDEGRIRFNGGNTIDPSIDLTAQEDVDGITVRIAVSGRATDPNIAFSSTPGLPQEEIISRILFGRSVANLSSIQAIQLAASLNSLRGSGKGINPLDKLRSATGFDRLRILGADEENGRGTAIAAGKYITDDIYIEVITDARGFTATQLEISLTPTLSILSSAGGSRTSDVNIQYEKNY